MSETVLISIIGIVGSLLVAVVPKLIDNKSGMKKDLKEIKADIEELKSDNKMNNDMIYQMLNHMATNNNTGGMARALETYNAYFRKGNLN